MKMLLPTSAGLSVTLWTGAVAFSVVRAPAPSLGRCGASPALRAGCTSSAAGLFVKAVAARLPQGPVPLTNRAGTSWQRNLHLPALRVSYMEWLLMGLKSRVRQMFWKDLC